MTNTDFASTGEEPHTLYYLSSSKDDIPFYIGITYTSLKQRLSNHCTPCQRYVNVEKYKTIRHIKKTGYKVHITEIVNNLNREEASLEETFYITYLRSLGCILTNMSDGGNIPSKETRDKISKAHIGKVLTEEHKNNMKKAADRMTDEQRAERSRMLKSRKLSQENIDALRASRIGVEVSEETREKLRIASTGRTHTDEAKAKISAIHRGKTISQEQIDLDILRKKGSKATEEACENMRKAAKLCPRGPNGAFVKAGAV